MLSYGYFTIIIRLEHWTFKILCVLSIKVEPIKKMGLNQFENVHFNASPRDFVLLLLFGEVVITIQYMCGV